MQKILTTSALALIRFYRRHISHRKGWCCIHAQVHRKGTCSQYGLKVFTEHDPFTALRLLRARLCECRLTYRTWVARMNKDQYLEHCRRRGIMASPHEALLRRFKLRAT